MPQFSGCGAGGEVVENDTVDFDGDSIGFVHSTCPQPGDSTNGTKRDAIEERQYICKKDDCEGYPVLQFQEQSWSTSGN